MRFHRLVLSAAAYLISIAVMVGGCAGIGVAHELTPSHSALKSHVEFLLHRKGILVNGNISVGVGNNGVVLTGTVPTLYKRKEAVKLTRSLVHGRSVVDNLEIHAPSVSDSAIDAEVMRRIRTQVPYTVFDWAEAHSKNGVVTLDGWVNNLEYIPAYQRQAERVPGVKKVVNDIKFTYAYNRLARRAVNLIYRKGDLFPGVSLRFDPPVHVIAVDGKVILEGKIGSPSFGAYLADRVRYHTDAIRVYNELWSPARKRA